MFLGDLSDTLHIEGSGETILEFDSLEERIDIGLIEGCLLYTSDAADE